MKTEKSFKSIVLYNYPAGIINAIKDVSGWELVNTTINGDQDRCYEIQFQGKRVLGFQTMHGFGFGGNASYLPLRVSIYSLLKSVYKNHMRICDGKISESVVYDNDYTDNISVRDAVLN